MSKRKSAKVETKSKRFKIQKDVLDKKDKNGNTVLLWACENDNTELVLSLIKSRVSLNVKNKNGDTPLIIACKNDNTELALFLIKNGVSTDVKNKNMIHL